MAAADPGVTLPSRVFSKTGQAARPWTRLLLAAYANLPPYPGVTLPSA
jgi:hypothetical protein